MNRQTFNSFQGQAAVHRVVSELLLRRINVYSPSVDTGVDFICENGCRVQVKSTFEVTKHWRCPEGTYSFCLSSALVPNKRNPIQRPAKKFSSFCDVIVLWAIKDNRFWIVPSRILDGRYSLTISTRHQWKEGMVSEIRSMRERGLSYREIGEQFGMSGHTAMRRLNGSYSEPRRNFASFQVKECENRWDLIESFGSLSSEKLEAMYNSVGAPEPNVLLTTPERAETLRAMYPETKE